MRRQDVGAADAVGAHLHTDHPEAGQRGERADVELPFRADVPGEADVVEAGEGRGQPPRDRLEPLLPLPCRQALAVSSARPRVCRTSAPATNVERCVKKCRRCRHAAPYRVQVGQRRVAEGLEGGGEGVGDRLLLVGGDGPLAARAQGLADQFRGQGAQVGSRPAPLDAIRKGRPSAVTGTVPATALVL